jgi:hypothetical protein
MSTNQYYILWRGQTTGPFTFDQIKQQLDQGRISLSHQVKDGDNLVFVEDFLDGKQAEVDQKKAEHEAMAVEAKALAEHARQKELLEIQAAAGFAQAQAAGAAAPPMLPMPGMPGQQQSSSESSDVVGIILTILIIIGVVVGGYFAYDHFSNPEPTLQEVKTRTTLAIEIKWLADPDTSHFSIESMDLYKKKKGEYVGEVNISSTEFSGRLIADLEVNINEEGDLVWQTSNPREE